MTKIFLVQFSDYLEQRILAGFESMAEADIFVDKQQKDGYGWFEVLELILGQPFAVRSLRKKFISGGKEVDPLDFEDLYFGEEEDYLDEEEMGDDYDGN